MQYSFFNKLIVMGVTCGTGHIHSILVYGEFMVPPIHCNYTLANLPT